MNFFNRNRKTSRKPVNAKIGRRALRFESLERRELLSAGNEFAFFTGNLDTNDRSDEIRVTVDPAAFGVLDGEVLLGLRSVNSLGQSLDPAPVTIRRLADGQATDVAPLFSTANLPGRTDSVVVAAFGAGDYQLGVTGTLQGRSQYRLESYLVGDANADGRVDATDLRMIQDAFGSRDGTARYIAAADANLDGRITSFDLMMARRNEIATRQLPQFVPCGDMPAESESVAKAELAGMSPVEGFNPDAPLRFYESTGGVVQSVGSDAIYVVPGNQGEMTHVVFSWDYRSAGYNNELGYYFVDDDEGSIEVGEGSPFSLQPGDDSYVDRALADGNFEVLFASGEVPDNTSLSSARQKVVELPAGKKLAFYLVQDNTTAAWRTWYDSAGTGTPVNLWLSFDSGNQDSYEHFQHTTYGDSGYREGAFQFKVEDLSPSLPNPRSYVNDADYNDVVFSVRDSWVDLDVDSMNNNTLGQTQSDAREENPALPGRWIAVNDRDSDGDGVPDFADGIDLHGNAAPSPGQFTQLKLTIPEDLARLNPSLVFTYSEANPNSIARMGGESPYYLPATTGNLVLWTNDIFTDNEAVRRSKNSVSDDSSPGNRIDAGTAHSIEKLKFNSDWQTTIWIEGINVSDGIGTDTITVEARLPGSGTLIALDRVRVTVVDVDIRFDNGATPYENQIEEKRGEIGQRIALNCGDTDGDATPDYADGFSVGGITQGSPNASARFTPLTITIPAPLDLTTATLTFLYSESTPSLASNSPPPGRIRIWTQDGHMARSGVALSGGGDWIDGSSDYSAAALGFGASRTVTVYVEGVVESDFVGTDRVLVYVNPDASACTNFQTTDAAHYTVFFRALEGQITYDPANPKAVRGARVVALTNEEIVAETWTDMKGNYFLPLHASDPVDSLLFRVYTTSRPEGTESHQIARAVSMSGYYDFLPSVLPNEGLTVVPCNVGPISDVCAFNRGFWVFDAAMTAATYHSTIIGGTGTIEVRYPAVGATCYALNGHVYITNDYYSEWDTIIHEYGHAVAQQLEFFHWDLLHLSHSTYQNMRDFAEGGYDVHYLELGFSEGWANFFSMAAQEWGTVSTPRVVGAKDQRLGNHPVESNQEPWYGEDHEVAVMRVLWDLCDPANEPSDRVQMRVDQLLKLCVDHKVHRLDKLWDVLRTNASSVAEISDYGRLFAAHGVGVMQPEMRVNGQVANHWNATQSNNTPPVFTWTIPTSTCHSLLFDSFRIRFYDFVGIFASEVLMTPANFRVIQGENPGENTAEWAPSMAAWEQVLSLGGRSWFVLASDHEADFTTGPYWSQISTFFISTVV